MRKAEVKSFCKPDLVQKFPKGRLEIITIGGAIIGRAIFEPGMELNLSAKQGMFPFCVQAMMRGLKERRANGDRGFSGNG